MLFLFDISHLVPRQYCTYRNRHPIKTPYLPKSTLRTVSITMDSFRSQMMFTAWCWNILGLTFALNGTITLISAYSDDENGIPEPAYLRVLMRTAFILFEIAVPTSMIVSSITRYVLWPRSLDTTGFKTKASLFQHNGNIIVAFTEVAILGRIPMLLTYMPLGVLYGAIYILHSWNMTHRWLPSGEPQFVYFFFDTTLDKNIVVLVLFALLCIITLFYCISVSVSSLVTYFDGGILSNILLVVSIALGFCRFRD